MSECDLRERRGAGVRGQSPLILDFCLRGEFSGGRIFLESLSLLLVAAILLNWILVLRLHRKSAQRPNEKSSVLEFRPFWRNSKIVWQMSSFTISLKASSFGTDDSINLQTDTCHDFLTVFFASASTLWYWIIVMDWISVMV